MRRPWFYEVGIWLLFVALLVPAAIVGYAIGHSAKQKTKTVVETPRMAAEALIEPAPAFTADDLVQTPKDDWTTNGGSTFNQRYSALDQIDTSNIAQVKGVWRTHLRGSGIGAKYSAESQPIEWQGTIYVPTGEDDVFAINADSGEILWEYKAHLDQTISTVCCGWESRGVAIGDGKVYLGQLDGKLVALDQKTGQVAWETQVVRWQDGGTITNAPLYYDGLVVTGISGGEFGIRGRVTAYDARTGKERWRFYTIPGPGHVGHDTWPADPKIWKHGGAPVWQTPALDPKLGLLYFSTGNAANDLDGSIRPGKNLFTAAMVAIDAHTGKYRWHFQMVHHDIWDYDAPSPVVLFDVNGKHGIGEPEKTGWLYLLDRTTGKPLVPIVEHPVPQDAFQKTWPTQPFPANPAFVDQKVSPQQFAQVAKLARASIKGGHVKIVNGKYIYAPPKKGVYTIVTPGPHGGDNWPPSSYNQDTHMFYVCAQSTVAAEIAASESHAAKQGQVPKENFGSLFSTTGFATNPGTLTAIDAASGRIVWQHRWVGDSCYSGTSTTHGNLVFVGRNNGELQAYDARNGRKLWSFGLGAGANNTATFFQRNGQERIAFYAGGNALAGTKHGDNLWLLGLDGTLGPVNPVGGSTAIEHAGEATGNNTPAKPNPPGQTANVADGSRVWAANCAVCHGASGHGGNGGPDLTSIASAKDVAVVTKQVANGGGGMPAFKGTLSSRQIDDVAAYVVTKITHGK
ncbi:MAG: PQQ-binding-like beta-propeller repeat protein [Gaiellaceae bacterium]